MVVPLEAALAQHHVFTVRLAVAQAVADRLVLRAHHIGKTASPQLFSGFAAGARLPEVLAMDLAL